MLPPIVMILFAISLVGVTSVHAQSTTATLAGTIVDETGAVVPGVEVRLLNVATRRERRTQGTEEGQFLIAFVPPGRYTLRATRDGFTPLEVPDVVLNVNDQIALRLQFKVAAIGEQITVVAEPMRTNTSPSVGTTVDRRFVENLPLNGRSLQALVALSPGVVMTPVSPDGSDQGQFSVNGQRANANYVTVDGVSANFGVPVFDSLGQAGSGSLPATSITGGFSNLASLDAIQEFRVQTSTVAPEFGRSPGAQVSLVTRSGGNQYRGSVFEYFRNDALDARDAFDVRKPPLRFNDFGGTFGGPIRLPSRVFRRFAYDGRNRTFFFASYEGQRFLLPQPTRTIVVPSEAARLNAPDDVARAILNTFAKPNGADTVGPTGTPAGGALYTATYSNPNRLDALSLRIDHQFAGSHSVFGRYNNSPSYTNSRDTGSFSSYSRFVQNSETLTFGATQVFSTRLMNEVRVNGSRQKGETFNGFDGFGGGERPPDSIFLPPGYGGQQRYFVVTITDIAGTSGISGFTTATLGHSAKNQTEQINVVDNVSYALAAHQLKFGIDYRWYSPTQASSGLIVSATFAGINDGVPNTGDVYEGVARSIFYAGSVRNAFVTPNVSVYLQDVWKAGARVTMTYGARWEVDLAPRGRGALKARTIDRLPDLNSLDLSSMQLAPEGTPYYKTTYANVAPRVGLAWVAHERSEWDLALHGGAGIFYDLGSTGLGGVRWPYGFIGSVRSVPVPIQSASIPLPPVNHTPSPTNRASGIAVAQPDHALPRTYQWNIRAEQSVGKHQSISIAYVGAAGRKLLRSVMLSISPPPGVAGHVPGAYYSPNFSSLLIVGNTAESDYKSLQMQFTRRLSQGLQALASYTWAHSTDTASSDSEDQAPGFIFDPEIERGNSSFDVRHVFSAAVTYSVPALRWGGVAKTALRDWSVHSVFFARSGFPFDVRLNEINAFNQFQAIRRLDVVPGVPLRLDDPAAPGGWRLNPAAFALPASANQQGTMKRNALYGFGAWQMDLGLRRRFDIRPLQVEFSVEAFNVFNHANFANPPATLNYTGGALVIPARFGESISSVARGFGGGGNTGGLNPLFQSGGPRSIQLALKILY